MHKCFVCGKQVTEKDEFIWFGLDGEKIHKNCEKNVQKAFDKINNMTDDEFSEYLLSKQ
jgi:hypothetical protein